MTLLTVTLRLSVLSSDHSECCWKLLNGSLSLVKADRIFTYSCLVSSVCFGISQYVGLIKSHYFVLKVNQYVFLK